MGTVSANHKETRSRLFDKKTSTVLYFYDKAKEYGNQKLDVSVKVNMAPLLKATW